MNLDLKIAWGIIIIALAIIVTVFFATDVKSNNNVVSVDHEYVENHPNENLFFRPPVLTPVPMLKPYQYFHLGPTNRE